MGAFVRYEIGERIGVGGMAEVHRAVAILRDGRQRPVVLKLILPQFSDDPTYRGLFHDEARIGAQLRHPNVIELLDVGAMDERLFLALELVEGADLFRLMQRARKLDEPIPLPIALFVASEVLKGLHYVHTRADLRNGPYEIVHRDVSPANVLVSRGGAVKLADFGVAKATIRAGKTVSGVIKGNPRYMAPEQLSGATVDARADVYGAGMVLYTMLAGRHPYAEVSMGALLQRALRGDPPPLADLRDDVPVQLSRMVARATRAYADDRFASALEFQLSLLELAHARMIRFDAEDLARYVQRLFPADTPETTFAPQAVPDLAAEPAPRIAEMVAEVVVDAGEPTHDEVVGGATPFEPSRFETRGGVPGPERAARTARRSRPTVIRRDPGRPGSRSRTVLFEERDAAEISLPPPTAEPAAAPPTPAPKSIAPTVKRLKPERDGASSRRVPAPAAAPAPERTRASARTSAKETTADLVFDDARVRWLKGHRGSVSALDAADRVAVSGGNDRSVIAWDLGEARMLRVLEGHRAAVTAVAVAADGSIAVSGSRDKTVRVWDLSSGMAVGLFEGHGGWIFSVAVSPDARRAVSAGLDRKIRVWNLDGASAESALEGHEDAVSQIAFLPDGRHVLSGGRDRTLRLWDLDARATVLSREDRESVRAIAVSPDGRYALSAGADAGIRLWTLPDLREVHRFTGHTEPVTSLRFSPDGAAALSASYDGTMRSWDVRDGRPLATYDGHADAVLGAVFGAAGEVLVSAGADGRVGLWQR